MPLYKSIAIDDETYVLVWHITESENELKKDIVLEDYSKGRIQKMKSELHRRAYYSVRHLLAIAQYTDKDLIYNEHGKPSLSDGVHVSITHSHEYAAIILSGKKVGIDIEKQREKINLIAHKFVNDKEQEYLGDLSSNLVKAHTLIWCAKESMYKLFGEKGVSFKEHMVVSPFSINNLNTRAGINYKEQIAYFDVHAVEFNGFTMAVVL